MIDFQRPEVLLYAAWAVACVVAWGKVFSDALGEYRSLPLTERRRAQPAGSRLPAVRAAAFREVVSDFALLLVSIMSFASLVVLIIGQEIPGIRGFFLAVALGGFVGAGIIRAWPDRRA